MLVLAGLPLAQVGEFSGELWAASEVKIERSLQAEFKNTSILKAVERNEAKLWQGQVGSADRRADASCRPMYDPLAVPRPMNEDGVLI